MVVTGGPGAGWSRIAVADRRGRQVRASMDSKWLNLRLEMVTATFGDSAEEGYDVGWRWLFVKVDTELEPDLGTLANNLVNAPRAEPSYGRGKLCHRRHRRYDASSDCPCWVARITPKYCPTHYAGYQRRVPGPWNQPWRVVVLLDSLVGRNENLALPPDCVA